MVCDNMAGVQRFKSGLDEYEFIRLVQATAPSEDILGFSGRFFQKCFLFCDCLWSSRVWNEAAAQRLITLGHRVRCGDLVWRQEEPKLLEDTGESNTPQVREDGK